jgi:hypothetical protein
MGAGPSIVVLVQPEHWTIGFLSNNVWSIGGERGRCQVDQFLSQYFVTYDMEKGWFLTEAPILTSDWMAPAHNRWPVPLAAVSGKSLRSVSSPSSDNLIRPQDIPSPKWQVRLQAALLHPKEK